MEFLTPRSASNSRTTGSDPLSLEEVRRLAQVMAVPAIQGRVYSGDHGAPPAAFAVDCMNFDQFARFCLELGGAHVEFLVYDEAQLDEFLLSDLHTELQRLSFEATEPGAERLVPKIITALRGHINTTYAITVYASLKGGRLAYVRRESPLALFIAFPEKMLTSESLDVLRKLHLSSQ